MCGDQAFPQRRLSSTVVALEKEIFTRQPQRLRLLVSKMNSPLAHTYQLRSTTASMARCDAKRAASRLTSDHSAAVRRQQAMSRWCIYPSSGETSRSTLETWALWRGHIPPVEASLAVGGHLSDVCADAAITNSLMPSGASVMVGRRKTYSKEGYKNT